MLFRHRRQPATVFILKKVYGFARFLFKPYHKIPMSGFNLLKITGLFILYAYFLFYAALWLVFEKHFFTSCGE